MAIESGRGDNVHREIHAIRSTTGSRVLMAMYKDKFKRFPHPQGLKAGMVAMEALAQRVALDVGLRTTPFESGFAIDLGDESWTRVLVRPGHWELNNQKPPFPG